MQSFFGCLQAPALVQRICIHAFMNAHVSACVISCIHVSSLACDLIVFVQESETKVSRKGS